MRRAFTIALCCACSIGCVSVNKGSRPLGSIVNAEQPAPEPGQWCRVTYPETKTGLLNRSQHVVTGRVDAVDDDGIHLSDVNGRSLRRTAVVGNVPYVKRLFTMTGIGTTPDALVKHESFERLEIISKQEAWQPEAQLVAQHLANAVPGRHRAP